MISESSGSRAHPDHERPLSHKLAAELSLIMNSSFHASLQWVAVGDLKKRQSEATMPS
jgi:hypothetical protein